MSDKNYFKNIKKSFNFIIKYLKVFRFLTIIIYLFFLATLIINVFSTVEYVPSVDEVREKFLPITSKSDVISSIENYFLGRKNNLTVNLQKEVLKDPFAPQEIENLNPIESVIPAVNTDNIIVPEANAIN